MTETHKAAVEALEIIDAIETRLDKFAETGTCCCGGEMEGHGFYDGHTGVDSGLYSARDIFKKLETLRTTIKQSEEHAFKAGCKWQREIEQPSSVEVEEAVETGRKMMAHAEGWIPDACLIGNMTAHDIYRSVQTLIEAATRQHPTPEPQGEPVYELGTGNLIGHKYFVPLKGEK